jgi:antitoxin (DNA-binding transcriptional repressor) of toxin-antitoxin stability system
LRLGDSTDPPDAPAALPPCGQPLPPAGRPLACARKPLPSPPGFRYNPHTLKRLNLATADRPLAEYAEALRDEIVLLTKRNRAVAAIVPLKNVDRESLTLSHHPEFLELIAKSRAEFAAGRKLSLAEMRRAVLPKRSAKKRIQPPQKKTARG